MPEQKRRVAIGVVGVLVSALLLLGTAWGQWVHGPEMKSRRGEHTATKLSDGRGLVAGGWETESPTNYLNTAEIFDPRTQSFRFTSAPAPTERRPPQWVLA